MAKHTGEQCEFSRMPPEIHEKVPKEDIILRISKNPLLNDVKSYNLIITM